MKFTSIFFLFFVFALPAFAQEPVKKDPAHTLDLQLWTQFTPGKVDFMPWGVYYDKNGLVVDVRYNYDAPKMVGAFVGKQFGGDKLYVIPEIGYVGGDGFRGISPEVYFGASVGRFSLSTQWQWVANLRESAGSWGYQWNEILLKIGEHLSVGADSQTFWEKGAGASADTDVGPALKLGFGGSWSLRVWGAVRTSGPNRGDWVVYIVPGKVIKW